MYKFIVWDSSTCITEESDENDIIECKCKSLSPATVIDDIDNILSNSKIEEVFSDEGLK